MKRYIILFIFITFYSLLNADTIIVSGDVSGIWSADTVMVIGDLTIPDGEALTIEPGTYIEFQDLYSFNIQGCLLAV